MLQDPLGWPEWWRGVARTSELDGGDSGRVGSRYRVAWRSRIPYVLEFDFTVRGLEEGRWMEGDATGDLQGTGCWRLFEDGGVTAVVYDWDVTSTKRWMNALGPIARPVFEYHHDAVMRWGGEGLARRLGVRLLAAGQGLPELERSHDVLAPTMAGHWGGQAAGGAELMTIDALTDSVETVLDSVGWDTAHVGAAS